MIAADKYVEAQYKTIIKDVDLVLLTAGGNGLNFVDAILQCFFLGNVAGCLTRLETSKDFVENGPFKGTLVDILRDIGTRMKPGGKVVLSVYPHLLMDIEYKFDKKDFGAVIRESGVRLDKEQQTTVNDANMLEKSNFLLILAKQKMCSLATNLTAPSSLDTEPRPLDL